MQLPCMMREDLQYIMMICQIDLDSGAQVEQDLRRCEACSGLS